MKKEYLLFTLVLLLVVCGTGGGAILAYIFFPLPDKPVLGFAILTTAAFMSALIYLAYIVFHPSQIGNFKNTKDLKSIERRRK